MLDMYLQLPISSYYFYSLSWFVWDKHRIRDENNTDSSMRIQQINHLFVLQVLITSYLKDKVNFMIKK